MNIKGVDGSVGVYQAQVNRANQPGAQRAAGNEAKSSAAGQSQAGKDTISVSFDGVLRTAALSTAMSAGDVRQEKVEAIRESLDNGEYVIDNHKIAAKLVQDERAIFGE